MSEAVIRVVSNRKILKESAYAGNIGIMELIKFKSKATPEQKKKFDSLVKNKKTKEVWEHNSACSGGAWRVRAARSWRPIKVRGGWCAQRMPTPQVATAHPLAPL